ncbi:MAG: hypothetical protein E7183_03420 [Erysipelotrichaceae bacterium]|nr:hypothetical protein [Erysipelotrichaceae bacterium]
MENNIRKLTSSLVEYYEIPLEYIMKLGSKSFKYKDETSKEYFLKVSPFNTSEKYKFLESLGVDNIIYPHLNKENEYLTKQKGNSYYLMDFYKQNNIISEVKAQNMLNELNRLHNTTVIKRQLSSRLARPKFEEITKELDYKFKIIENYVRSIEYEDLNVFSMPILGNYQYILDAKKELVMLQKRIINFVKAKEKVEYVYVHNRPSLDHLLNIKGINYLVSAENGKIGISSLDLAKFYLENEDLDIDFEELIVNNILKNQSPFYYDYFRFLVLYILIKKIVISSEKYLTAQSFINVSDSIKKYFSTFLDHNKNVSNQDES